MRVVVSPHNVVNYPPGGVHFWVYLQYVDGLKRLGCDVWWLEEFRPTGDSHEDAERVTVLAERLRRFGMDDRLLLYTPNREFVNVTAAGANAVFAQTDLLRNFHQRIAD